MVYYSNELYHHGILGQKWGRKNGPPYPLKPSDHSASEKKSGWRKSLNTNIEEINKRSGESQRIHLTDKQKKAILIGVGTAAAVGVGIYLAKSGKINALLPNGKAAAEKVVDSFGSVPMSALDSDMVSPSSLSFSKIDRFSGGPPSEARILNDLVTLKKDSKTGGSTNCVACVVQGFLRNYYGLDVVAKERGREFTINELTALFSDYKHKRFDSSENAAELARNIRKELLSNGEGSTGIIAGNYSDKFRSEFKETFNKELEGNGHAFSWTVCNGRIVFSDYQQREIGDHLLSMMLNMCSLDSFSYGRFDGQSIDKELINIFVENRK